MFRMSQVRRSAKKFSLKNIQHFNFRGDTCTCKQIHFSTWPTTRNLVVEQEVLLRMCAKLLLGGGPQGIANLQLLQGFLRNNHGVVILIEQIFLQNSK